MSGPRGKGEVLMSGPRREGGVLRVVLGIWGWRFMSGSRGGGGSYEQS